MLLVLILISRLLGPISRLLLWCNETQIFMNKNFYNVFFFSIIFLCCYSLHSFHSYNTLLHSHNMGNINEYENETKWKNVKNIRGVLFVMSVCCLHIFFLFHFRLFKFIYFPIEWDTFSRDLNFYCYCFFHADCWMFKMHAIWIAKKILYT